jgi:hypothetical protein
LNGLTAIIHPLHDDIFAAFPQEYYWTVHQSEYATDVMFKSPEDLARIYPAWVRYAMTQFGSGDVMRFLGRKVPSSGRPDARFEGEVVTDLKTRPEGVCVRHRVNHNGIKQYDKAFTILRNETTIYYPWDFKVYRTKEGDPNGEKSWRPMRKGIADLYRRAKVSHACNDRYLKALAAVEIPTRLKTLAAPLCQPAQCKGRRVRALNPLAAEDAQLLEAVNRGEFVINGFRNRDLRALLYTAEPLTPKDAKRQSSAVTRKLRLLRAHGLIQKIKSTHRYQLTAQGRRAITALLTARQATVSLLAKEVA